MPYLQLPITIESDQPDSAPLIDSIPAAIISTVLLIANPARKGAIITNLSTGDLYVALGETASMEAMTTIVLAPKDSYEIPFSYRGVISGIWETATGVAMTTELT